MIDTNHESYGQMNIISVYTKNLYAVKKVS